MAATPEVRVQTIKYTKTWHLPLTWVPVSQGVCVCVYERERERERESERERHTKGGRMTDRQTASMAFKA